MTTPPRLIGRKEAADYLGIGESTFSLWVANGKMPPAIPGTRKWDKRAIDARLDEISGLTTRDEDDFDRMLRESDARRSKRDLDNWRRERDARKRS